MGNRHADRVWMYGGVAGAVLLLVLGWFLAIRPVNAEADGLREQSGDTQTQLLTLRKRLHQLQEQAKQLDTYRTALKTKQEALTTNSGMPDFLRSLQETGDAVSVDVNQIAVSPPVASTTVPTVLEVPIVLTAEGASLNLVRWLDQLQTVQPRAVLIEGVSLDGGTVGVRLRAFVTKSAVRAGTATATPTASAAAVD
jgi:Tfp pilus assembly protein PilO